MRSFRGYRRGRALPNLLIRIAQPIRAVPSMDESREEVIRQIRQCELDRLTTDDPKLREKLRKLILQLQGALAQMGSI